MAKTVKRKNCKKATSYNCGKTCINVNKGCPSEGISAPGKKKLEDLKKTITSAKSNTDQYQGKIDTSKMTLLGSGMTGSVYSDGKGNAVKVETINNVVGGSEQGKKSVELNNEAADLGIAPRVKQYYTEGNNVYTVMENLEGYESLETMAENSVKIGKKESKALAKSINSVVGSLNKAKIGHGDLHIGNLMYNKETGDVKIIDFSYATKGAKGFRDNNNRAKKFLTAIAETFAS